MRRLLAVAVLTAALAGFAPAGAGAQLPPGSEDSVAKGYYRLLLEHTRWAETVYDAQAGTYQFTDYNFAVVLGNAVLLRFGDYDASVAGVDRATLRDHTIRTIQRFAADNRFADPDGSWGGKIFWDATFESYFTAAAKLLWDDLDPTTQANVDKILAGEADYVASLRDTEDPRSGGWSSNGLRGGYVDDSKIEEMGAKSMPLAAAVAYLPDSADAGTWREWMNRWTLNLSSLPAADAVNTTEIDGRPVSWWATAHNIWDTFMVENHGSWAPMYQESIGAYPGRNAAQFLIAGRPIPDALRAIPNGDETWRALDELGTDAGVPEDLMVADRHHLYGRNVLPIAYRAVVAGDPYAARAERMLLEHLGPYVAYAPENRLTKFSGEPKYEPEARAELAMAFLLHYWRGQAGGGAEPVSESRYFAGRSGVVDRGPGIGVISQQSPRSLAAAVTKPGYAKFAFLPQHDDWLFDVAGSSPSLLPSVSTKISSRSAHEYRRARDGYDASATLVRTPSGFAGFSTLPDGEAVYATSGLAADEGALRLYNLNMPGVAGLDGDRTFTGADGAVTVAATAGLGDGGTDDVHFAATTARYVRMVGIRPVNQYGYSLYDVAVPDANGTDLARGKPTTASSFDGRAVSGGPFNPERATDGNPATRWAVSVAERGRPDSWLAVDLGSAQRVDEVRLQWESAYGAEYKMQVSDDGTSWRDVARIPDTHDLGGNWLNVDRRAGFVVRGSSNPIRVSPTSATLSAGPAADAAGMVVEARPAEDAAQTAAAAGRPAPSGGPVALRASTAGGYLSLFNLGADPISGAGLRLPGNALLYRGTQRTDGDGTVYDVDLATADARVEAPRFRVLERHGDPMPSLRIAVADSRHVTVENPGAIRPAQLVLRSIATGESREVTVPAGTTREIAFRFGRLTPADDLARTRTTYPTSPLPSGMTDPDRAVDGNPWTAWRAAGGGRMVVDLGASRAVGAAVLRWTGHGVREATVALSDDGLTWHDAGAAGRDGRVALAGSAHYVAVDVPAGAAGLADLEVRPG